MSEDRPGDSRSRLLEAAFEVLSTAGFEGLRTRNVAEKAGVNVATLHYYFPTKEALIGQLAGYIGSMFASIHAPSPPTTGRPSLDRLRQEFADGEFYMRERPQMLLAMQEFGTRAHRDPVVQGLLHSMAYHFRKNLLDMVQQGVSDGTFRQDLDPEQVSTVLVALMSGMTSLGAEAVPVVQRAVEEWLVVPAGVNT